MLSDCLTSLLRDPETPQYVIIDIILEECGKVPSVYVVYGESGEYSDYNNWTVAGFLDVRQAEKFRDKLNEWCHDNYCLADRNIVDNGKIVRVVGNYSSEKMEEKLGVDSRDAKCPLDPSFKCNYTGVSYAIWEMSLKSDNI